MSDTETHAFADGSGRARRSVATTLLTETGMTLKKQMKQRIGKRATRRVYSVAPWVGAALAVGAGTLMTRNGTLGRALERGRAAVGPERRQTFSDE